MANLSMGQAAPLTWRLVQKEVWSKGRQKVEFPSPLLPPQSSYTEGPEKVCKGLKGLYRRDGPWSWGWQLPNLFWEHNREIRNIAGYWSL